MAERDARSYAEKLKDPRWQKLRLEVLNRHNWSCEICHDGGSELNVHHSYYDKDCEPWEYPAEMMHCLCRRCHDEAHQMDKAFSRAAAYLTYPEKERMRTLVMAEWANRKRN